MNNSTSERTDPAVAVIGSGPSGCFTAQFLRKELPAAEICVFEALPVPYGLVRYGVAADHQGAKSVAQQFDRMFERGHATFVGNVRVGRDISFDALAEAFDVVVLATGLAGDRRLQIPQDESANVIGAGRILRALNGFPVKSGQPLATLGRDVAVIGHGNVAIDTVRLLTKRPDELVGSDIDDHVLGMLRPEPLRSVHLVGRSSVENAKFDLAMLRELCQLGAVRIRAEGLGESASIAADLLREAERRHDVPSEPQTTVTLHFEAVPTRIADVEGSTSLEVACGPAGESKTLIVDTVITATGFCQGPEEGTDIPDETWSGAHIYRVGWLDRGARGNIAENRKHAQGVARRIVDDLAAGRVVAERPGGLQAILPQLQRPSTSFSAWRAIDEVERARAARDRCRRKITDVAEMVALAGRAPLVDA